MFGNTTVKEELPRIRDASSQNSEKTQQATEYRAKGRALKVARRQALVG